MKKLFALIFSSLFLFAGCSTDITNNPVVSHDNTSIVEKKLQKNISELTYKDLPPEMHKFIEMKRNEYGVKFNPNLKPFKSERVDIKQFPDMVPLTLNEIEKLSTGNGRYFSGHNLVERDEVTFDYYSWCVPFPSPQKPIFEYMGSGQTSSVQSEVLGILSAHYLNGNYQDELEEWTNNASSISVDDYHTQVPGYPYCAWEVGGKHYFLRFSTPPYFQFLDYSYANDGLW